MILNQATIQYKGYDLDDLKPNSHKRVCVSCDQCGRVRWVPYQAYRGLCKCCAMSGKNNPNFGKHWSDEVKDKIRLGNIGRKHTNTEIRKQINGQSGENHWNYGLHHNKETKKKMSCIKQGINIEDFDSFIKNSPYCPKFNKLCRESNRDKYNRECFICGKPESENITKNGIKWMLSVYHVDMNKNQGCNSEWSLIPLCLQCHGMVHNDLWQYRIEYLLNKGE